MEFSSSRITLRTPRIFHDEVETLFAGLLLDAVVARDQIKDGTHLSSWIGDMAESFLPVYNRLVMRGVLNSDPSGG